MRAYLRVGLRWTLAVFINTLLNLIDAIAVGQLIFPSTDPFFKQFSVDGICLYLICTAVAQMIYPLLTSFQTSVAAGMMAESLPFLNSMAFQLKRHLLREKPTSLMPTLLLSMAVHTLLISGLFFALALFRLDSLVKKVPKYVLLGAMGGIGCFLLRTAFNQAKSIPIALMGFLPALATVVARKKYPSPFLVPSVSICIIFIFYLFSILFWINLDKARNNGWLIEGPTQYLPPFGIYKHFSISQVSWKALWELMPTMASSAVFSMLHLPINGPAFSRTSQQVFDMNQELIANGVINFVTSIMGLLPSYFIYTASVLFLQAGADIKICSYLLSIATASSLWIAIPHIRLIPVPVVLFLLFYLGLELLKESVVDGFNLISRREYFTIWAMISFMMLVGFPQGFFTGIFLSIVFLIIDLYRFGGFHADNRPVPTGEDWTKLTNYSPTENAFLEVMREEVQVLSLPGFYHFANSDIIYDSIKQKLHHVRYLIVDLRGARYMDLNAVEMFDSVQRLVKCVSFVTASNRIGLLDSRSQGRLKRHIDLVDALAWIDRLQLLDFPNNASTCTIADQSFSLLSVTSPTEVDYRAALLDAAHQASASVSRDESAYLSLIESPMMLSVEQGSCLWQNGESLQAVYMVEEGSFEERDGDMIVRRHYTGAWMGLANVVNDQSVTTDCYSMGPSKLRCIPITQIRDTSQTCLAIIQPLT